MPEIRQSDRIAGVHIVEPSIHGDQRGLFIETYRREFGERFEAIELEDADGHTVSRDTSEYGGVTDPYPRDGLGAGQAGLVLGGAQVGALGPRVVQRVVDRGERGPVGLGLDQRVDRVIDERGERGVVVRFPGLPHPRLAQRVIVAVDAREAASTSPFSTNTSAPCASATIVNSVPRSTTSTAAGQRLFDTGICAIGLPERLRSQISF